MCAFRQRNMKSQRSEPVVLLTGATGGIGLALAELLVQKTNYRLVFTGRSSESLERLHQAGIRESDRVMLRILDVTQKDEAYRLYDEIAARWQGVDTVINNAGISFRAVLEHVHHPDEIEQFETNYFGPMRLIRLSLPWMRNQRHGRIINVSSVGGMMAMPTMSIYSASKFSLEGASEGLWYELRPWNIKVTLIQPGFIRSEGFQHVRLTPEGIQALKDSRAAYHGHYHHMEKFIARYMHRALATNEAVARKILKVMEMKNPPLRLPATWDAHIFALIRRFLPRRMYHHLLYRMLPGIKTWGPQKKKPGRIKESKRGPD